ncbi:hypothetical protein ACIBO1_20520 [Micromonospora sp. NPDC049903]|uniref:hypothetical protein n=1 Tax=Micromonospora sp. NPDC049903 TaxID=3364276 RepID=UPI0037908D9B
MPVLRNWWSCYDLSGELPPPSPELASDAVGRLGTVAWELLPPVPLAQVWGVEARLLDVLRVQAAQLRRRHELTALALVLAQIAVLDTAAGRWGAAEVAAAEGLRLAEEVGVAHLATQSRSCLGVLAAARATIAPSTSTPVGSCRSRCRVGCGRSVHRRTGFVAGRRCSRVVRRRR